MLDGLIEWLNRRTHKMYNDYKLRRLKRWAGITSDCSGQHDPQSCMDCAIINLYSN